MRLCLYNPQAVHGMFGLNLFYYFYFFFDKNKTVNKHFAKFSYFIDLLRDKKNKIAIIIDGTATSLTSSSFKFKFLSDNYCLLRIISFFEIYLWCFLNQINPFKQKIVFRFKELKDDDIIICFPHITDTFINQKVLKKSFLYHFNGQKIAHLTHFYGRTKIVSQNVKNLKIKFAISETDLSESLYYKKFYSYIEHCYILPYILRPRYIKTSSFKQRLNKCLALGSFEYLNINKTNKKSPLYDYFNFFKINTYHTMRKTIYENKNKLSKIIDCLIFPLSQPSKKKSFKSNISSYHSFNIVEKYNQYTMFITPEENIGLPSINVIEGMACGCAYIGLKHHMYSSLGFKDKVNYIGYNGSLNDLVIKIKYYQSHPILLKKISKNGYKLVTQKFTKNKVINNFYENLKKLVRSQTYF